MAGRATTADGSDPVLQRWQDAKLQVSAFTKAETAIGPSCQTGTVSGIDVALCTFASEAEARKAEPAGLTWVAATTGAVLVSGERLVAIADRRTADPSGRTINAIAKAFAPASSPTR